MTYSEKIKEIRKSKKMTLREFGSLVGYDFTYIGLLERGISKAGSSKRLNPSIGVLKDICDRSGYDFRKFLEETGYLVSEPKTLFESIFNLLNDDEREMTMGYMQGLLERRGANLDILQA